MHKSMLRALNERSLHFRNLGRNLNVLTISQELNHNVALAVSNNQTVTMGLSIMP